jgi:hypothetical protein
MQDTSMTECEDSKKQFINEFFIKVHIERAAQGLDSEFSIKYGLDMAFMLALLENQYNRDGAQNNLITENGKRYCKIVVADFLNAAPLWKKETAFQIILDMINSDFIEVTGNINQEELMYKGK